MTNRWVFLFVLVVLDVLPQSADAGVLAWGGNQKSKEEEKEYNVVEYGVDCSFPIHNKELRCGDLLGDRKAFYEDFMQGCRDKYGTKASRCDQNEDDRLVMSLRQPQSMVNYTSTGFMKIRAPAKLQELLQTHWDLNKDQKEEEKWSMGNIYVNHWKSPTYMVSVENSQLRGAGYGLKNRIWRAAQETIETWTGMEQKPISMYGIRIYTEGAVLSPHVDRLPLVSSAIVNVAQDVDEPWPLEVIDREGRAVNVTMEPFDMVLYESGSLIHARPFPLKGRYMANIFIHFEPTGRPLSVPVTEDWEDELLDDFLPPYLVPGSPWAEDWTKRNPQGWKKSSPSAQVKGSIHSPEGHSAAAMGDIARVKEIARRDRRALNKKDMNGWQPLHEAIRSGHADIVQLLIEKHGAEKDARTGSDGKGSSPLNLARHFLEQDHPVIQYLQSIGAKDVGIGEL